MSEATQGQRTPMHLWIVGVGALLWNSVGAYDYLMTETRNATYFQRFTAEQAAFFEAMPSWVIATWALSVWCGVLGALLLLGRRRVAVPVLAVGLIGMLLTHLRNYGFAGAMAVIGDPAAIGVNLLVFAVAVCVLVYARRQVQSGVLR